MAVINNKYKSCVLHATSNSTFVIAGNNTVSNITSSSTQILTGANITRIWHGASGGGYWNLKRGSNLVSTFTETGYILYDGASLSVDKTATVVLELVGTANGYIMVELHKEGNLE